MPKKTTILIVILAIVTGILIFLAVRSDQGQNLLSNDQATTPTQVQPYASMSFENPTLDASTGPATQSVNILIDTAGKPIAGAQIELSYNPSVLTDVVVKTPQVSFFGANPNILINSVDSAQGRISYAVGMSATETEKSGKGTLATITFTVNRLAGATTTSLTFLPKSAVTTLSSQGSILNATAPLEIKLISPSPTAN